MTIITDIFFNLRLDYKTSKFFSILTFCGSRSISIKCMYVSTEVVPSKGRHIFFLPIFAHLFNIYLLRVYRLLDIVLGTED